jgi:hypothetical protein
MSLQQNLLPDLPDYETAVNDPRYAKKPPIDGASASASQSSVNNNNGNCGVTASTISVPPPPYSVAVAAEPLTFNFEVPDAENPAFREEETTQQNAFVPPSSSSSSSENIQNTTAAAPAPAEESPASQNSNEPLAVQVIDVAPVNADSQMTAPTAPTDR